MTRCERKKFTAAVNEFRRQIPLRAAMASNVPSVNFRKTLKRRFVPIPIPNFSIDAVEALAEFFR